MPDQDRPPGEWMAIAEDDLGQALHLRTAPEPYVRGMCYHAQQCAEKYLEAFLVARGVKFRKVHDLDYLVSQCAAVDDRFEPLRDAAGALDHYSILIRHPGPDGPPTLDEADSAVACARQIRDFVLARLEATPGAADGTDPNAGADHATP
jgi:HEPN domain-containing protein